jgi:hypothetical protein
MKNLCASTAFVIAIASALAPTVAARADTTQIEGVAITVTDISTLLAALNTALKPNDATIPLFVVLKSPGEMPAYDPRWHYAGIREEKAGTKGMYVWFNKDLGGADMQSAINAAFLLALTDGGYGGPAFKQLYDIYATRDAQLPTGAADPFLNRQKFAAALAHMLQVER